MQYVASAIIFVFALGFTILTVAFLMNAKSVSMVSVAGPCAIVMWGMGLWLFRFAWRMGHARIVLSAAGLEITSQTFHIAQVRGMQSGRFRWDEVRAVQYWPLVNFLSTGGVERNYLVHTPETTFLISSNFWPNAEGAARAIADHIHRAIDETPVEIVEAQRQDVRKAWFRYALLRAFGWISIVIGLLTLGVLLLVFIDGAKMPIEEMIMTAIVAVILVLGGRSMTKYRPPIDAG